MIFDLLLEALKWTLLTAVIIMVVIVIIGLMLSVIVNIATCHFIKGFLSLILAIFIVYLCVLILAL